MKKKPKLRQNAEYLRLKSWAMASKIVEGKADWQTTPDTLGHHQSTVAPPKHGTFFWMRILYPSHIGISNACLINLDCDL